MRALRVAVACPILGACLVGCEGRLAAVSSHLYKVEGPVETAWKLRNIDIESKFLVFEVEHLVVVLVFQEVDTGTDVSGILAFRDELKLERVSRGGNTVCARVVCAIEGTVGGTGLWVGAEGGVPLVAVVTVVGTLGAVKPAPVRVQNDGAGLV